jgi:hypothetical protein
MADAKISALTELTAVAADDELVIVDKSDISMAASGTNKRIKQQNIMPSFGSLALITQIVSAAASSATLAIDTYYSLRVVLLSAATVTGVIYRVGATSNGNVRSALYSTAGVQLAARTTNAAQGTANSIQTVAFDTPYAAAPGLYDVLLWFSSASATWMGGRHLKGTVTGTQSGGVPTTISGVATENADRPIMTTF